MQVKTIKLIDCPLDLYKKLYSLNLRLNGLMRNAMISLKKIKYKPAIVHYIEYDGLVYAWSLLFWSNYLGRYKSYFYIRQNKREQGLGKKLFNTVENYCIDNNLKFKVFPHDPKSYDFFTKCLKGKRVNTDDSLIHVSNYRPITISGLYCKVNRNEVI